MNQPPSSDKRAGIASQRAASSRSVDAPTPADLELLCAIEAALMVTDTPISAAQIATAIGITTAAASELLAEIAADYRGERGGRSRGFELREGAQGWRIYSAPAYADVVARLVLEGATSQLSQAALETLAVVAYRQPVTRSQISAIRGVNVDGVVRTLVARNLIAAVGTDPVSGAVLFATTAEFLDRMGWRSLAELPPIAPHLPGAADLPPDAGSFLTQSQA